MKESRRRWSLTVLIVILFLLALAAESVYFSDVEYHFRTRRFNKVLAEKEMIMEECLNGLQLFLARNEPRGSISEASFYSVAEENEITILYYLDRKLINWSDNGFDVPRILDDSLFTKPMVFLQNGWFLPKRVQAGNETLIGLLRIRTDYGFENDIIKNGFEKDFRIPGDVEINLSGSPAGYNIYNREGTLLFSLSFPEVKSITPLIIIPLVLWVLFFIMIILLALRIVEAMVNRGWHYVGIIACLLVFVIFYLVILIFSVPHVLFTTGLFSPYIFSLNDFIPSLGHFMLLSIIAALFSYVVYKYLPLNLQDKDEPVKNFVAITFILSVTTLSISLFHSLFSHLVEDSNISFETYKVLQLSVYSLIGVASVILLSLVPLFLILKIYQAVNHGGLRRISLPVLISLLLFVIIYYNDPWSLLVVSLFYTGLLLLIWIGGKRKTGLFNMTIIFSLLLGVYSVSLIMIFSEKRITENLKIQAISFSTENDPEAEQRLLDMWPLINNDTILDEMMAVEVFGQNDFNNIYNYLQETYFSGYWGNFRFTIVPCRKNELLRVGPGQNNYENCFGFFDERISKYGHLLTGTGFYFIDNQGGRSYYIGRLFFNAPKRITNGLFIELYSDIDVFQPGYYELLLDKKFRGYSGLKDFSFAKYINGEVVLRSGSFPYDKEDNEYIDKKSDFRLFHEGHFKHVLYRNGNATVIISRPELTIGDIIISFAYLFAFIFVFCNLLLLMIRRPGVKGAISFDFRQKLQFSFIGILLFSFILIGTVVAFLTVNEYRSKHYENIREKLNSIYFELDNRLSGEKHLTSDWHNGSNSSLNDLLINLSNIFNTDINLYDLNGFLIATSRPEIFSRDLLGPRINNMAFINLHDLTKSEYFQTEKIGSMKYISVYVPFFNTDNNVLAYLNIPYFRMQSILAREISNLVVAVINFTLLLILITMSFAVFLSRRLTSPLSMLGEGLASVELGKKIEHLSYNGTDEIGELVKQYNRMVDELEASAHKLANSEREYAWREMAKQIAHEIKNPLTPMKLNVQQLLKSWKDDAAGFEKKLQGFARNQIEYIDNLSSIASAFSAFAKMPGTNPVEVNLNEQIRTTLELFSNVDNISFSVQWPQESKIFIFADREHLNGIFSNLFKNSIQSIPQGKKGLIKVALEVIREKVIVSIEDNGSGIPETLQKKLFTPNFTTKTSGMGLGLSIVRKYVESANGRIWFDSEAEKGTTFYIEFPLIYTVEKPGEAKTD
jgi:two-component system nitrogen regulation sensor histidine kinase NtrY